MTNNNKKPVVKAPLTLVEIITRADAATIQAALEARQKIDALLAERAAAYERIAALERQVDEVLGDPGLFVFPAPAVPVAAFVAAAAPAAPLPPPEAKAAVSAPAVSAPAPVKPESHPEHGAAPAESSSRKATSKGGN